MFYNLWSEVDYKRVLIVLIYLVNIYLVLYKIYLLGYVWCICEYVMFDVNLWCCGFFSIFGFGFLFERFVNFVVKMFVVFLLLEFDLIFE